MKPLVVQCSLLMTKVVGVEEANDTHFALTKQAPRRLASSAGYYRLISSMIRARQSCFTKGIKIYIHIIYPKDSVRRNQGQNAFGI